MSTRDIEAKLNWVSLVLVATFGLALALGLILHIQRPGSREASVALHAGLVLLMASPAARLLIALAERIRRGDWTFIAMTAIVAAELALVMWRATQQP